MKTDPSETTIHETPHAFTNRKGECVLIKTLDAKRRGPLLKMYLAYEPRNSFSGLPPITDAACTEWVSGMIASGINLIALCFDKGVIGHAALFGIDEQTCELLVVVCPPEQNIGIGSELTRCAIHAAHELGAERIRLNVEANNHIARHVYEKCGFQYLGRERRGELDMSMDLRDYRGTTDVAVKRIMKKHVITVHPDTTCRDALMIFLQDNIATLPVVNEENKLEGILSETDLLAEVNIHKQVGDVLTRKVVRVREDCTLARMLPLFRSRKLRCIPVVNDRGQLVGIVGRRDILSYYLRGL